MQFRFTHLNLLALLAAAMLLLACDDDQVGPRHDPGYGWSEIAILPAPLPILRAMASTDSGLVAVGDGGLAALGGPEQWHFAGGNPLPRLNSVWVSPAGELFGAGIDKIVRYDGDTWIAEDSVGVEYHDVGGNSSIVFAVGNEGTIKRRQDDFWIQMGVFWPSGIVHHLLAVSVNDTDGFISGTGGTVLWFNGTHWEHMQTHSGETLWDIIALESASFRAMAVGSAGTVLSLSTDTGEWSTMTTPVTTSLHTVAIGPSGNVCAAGMHGVILSYRHDQWVSLESTPTHIVGLCVHDGALYACGGDVDHGGMLFRFGPNDP